MIDLTVRHECFPLAGRFTISRGSRTQSDVVLAELTQGGVTGRGECLPYPRYGETVEGVVETIESLRGALARGLDRMGLQKALPPGAARNALDCALWDLEAKQAGCRVWELLGQPAPRPVVTAYTLSFDSAENMGAAAAKAAQRPLLKLKLAGPDNLDRIAAVRAKAPRARIMLDANEGWTPAIYADLAPHLAVLGVDLVEQPLPAGEDQALATMQHPVPVCADESCHDRAGLEALVGLYDFINIKLDKTGGLTEALALKAAAEAHGLRIMVGSMLATSLSMAPALLVAQRAEVVDLDGPLLLAHDRPDGLRYEDSRVYPPVPALWG
ncbi:MAG TPA: N-acetyl-D-Glu racemase DgcA [Kiloniellales bacterium]